MNIHESAEDYLEMILMLREEKGYARSTDIAAKLGVTKPSVSFAMKNLRDCQIVMHIHDEVVIDAPPELTLQTVCDRMGTTPPWMPGLLLRADGYETDFYKKD